MVEGYALVAIRFKTTSDAERVVRAYAGGHFSVPYIESKQYVHNVPGKAVQRFIQTCTEIDPSYLGDASSAAAWNEVPPEIAVLMQGVKGFNNEI